MTEENNNPCTEPLLPEESEPGDPVTPEVEGFSFDPPRFPILETEFEGVPSSRTCTMVPRNFFYNLSERSDTSIALEASDSPLLASARGLTSQNPDPEGRNYDNFRFMIKNIFDFNYYGNKNFTANPWPEVNPHWGNTISWIRDSDPYVGWAVLRAGTLLHEGLTPLSHPSIHLMAFCSGEHAETFFRTSFRNSDQVTQNPDVLEFYKQFINLKGDEQGTRRERTTSRWYTDNSFTAPAAFFAKESDGLNLRLPETVSMQTFIPDMLTYRGDSADYSEFYGEANQNALLKKSVYERYSMEYDERPEHCLVDDSFASVHKFPADRIEKLNSITAMICPEDNQPQFNSFKNIFESEYKYYTKISFDINHTSPIAAKLKEKNLDHLLMGVIDTESPSKKNIFTQIIDERVENFVGVVDNDGVSLNTRPNSYMGGIKENLMKYLNPNDAHSKRANLNLALDPATYPLSYKHENDWLLEWDTESFGPWDPRLYTMQHWGQTSQFYEWLKAHLEGKDVLFDKRIQSELSYSEVIAYRLEKRDSKTGAVLQNFYFFNDPDTERINFVDTQINFGSKYTYSIYVINFVCGLKYRYRPLYEGEDIKRNLNHAGFITPNGMYLDVVVDQKKDYWIIESPYHQQDLLVSDAPPLSPDVTFLPWETLSENLAIFWFSPRLGEVKERPISILESDQEVIEKMKLAQNISQTGDLEILYRSDSDPTHYEMFVLDRPPLSYHDFLHARHTEATIASPTILKRVQPNRDYYLTFRARDLGGISQPTKIFRFRISSFGDGIEHEIEEYNFPTRSEDHLMQFDQLLEIMPSDQQSTMNFENSENYSENVDNLPELMKTSRGTTGLSLGPSNEESMWDKTFIFEITSAQTGKVFKIEASWSQIVEGNLDSSDPEEFLDIFLKNACWSAERSSNYIRNRAISDDIVGERIEREIDETSDSSPSRTGRGSYENQ